jgi:hypothetical protein
LPNGTESADATNPVSCGKALATCDMTFIEVLLLGPVGHVLCSGIDMARRARFPNLAAAPTRHSRLSTAPQERQTSVQSGAGVPQRAHSQAGSGGAWLALRHQPLAASVAPFSPSSTSALRRKASAEGRASRS